MRRRSVLKALASIPFVGWFVGDRTNNVDASGGGLAESAPDGFMSVQGYTVNSRYVVPIIGPLDAGNTPPQKYTLECRNDRDEIMRADDPCKRRAELEGAELLRAMQAISRSGRRITGITCYNKGLVYATDWYTGKEKEQFRADYEIEYREMT